MTKISFRNTHNSAVIALVAAGLTVTALATVPAPVAAQTTYPTTALATK